MWPHISWVWQPYLIQNSCTTPWKNRLFPHHTHKGNSYSLIKTQLRCPFQFPRLYSGKINHFLLFYSHWNVLLTRLYKYSGKAITHSSGVKIMSFSFYIYQPTHRNMDAEGSAWHDLRQPHATLAMFPLLQNRHEWTIIKIWLHMY